MKIIILIIVCASIGACATKAGAPLVVSGETAVIQGEISESTAAEFKRALGQSKISRVLLASGGGSVEPAIAIASEIRDRKIDVEVVGNCFSSCANYVFPAGATKIISGLGVVAWHGNMSHLLHLHASGVKTLDSSKLAEVQRLAKLENEFFASIGLNQFICWFGKISPYNVRNLYFLSTNDMARFGLANVNVRPGYEQTDVSSYNDNGKISNLQYIKVDWSTLKAPVSAH
ncbi:MAG: hypothetical protein WBE39_14930 [Candidatus Competibacter sp.]